MPRFVPPAGTPIRIVDIIRALRAAAEGRTDEDAMLALAARLGMRHAWGVSSGRGALCVVLRSLRRLRPERTVVALPAYTCFSVAASIVRAGLTLHPLDINPDTLDLDRAGIEKLPEETLLCIITPNLLGYVCDIAPIRRVAQQRGAFVLDNGAQALGSVRDGRFAGTRGDVGIFSLGRGKPISAMEGGLIVADAEAISRAIASQVDRLRAPRAIHSAYLLLQLAGYAALLHPSRYWIPNAIPFLRLGTTEFNPHFPIRALHLLARNLLHVQWDRIGTLHESRRSNAARLTDGLRASSAFYIPQPAPGTQASPVRLPVIAPDERTRALAVTRLRRAGIGASSF